MTDEEKQKMIFNMQSPSTQRAMRAHEQGKSLEGEDWPPKGWLAVADAKNMDEAVAARSISYAEAKLHQGLRYNRGAILAQMRKEEDASSVDAAKKERGIAAFTFVRVKFKDLMREAKQLSMSTLERAREYVGLKNEN